MWQVAERQNEIMIVPAIALLCFVNVWTIGAFWIDKKRAIAGARRVREADLLWLAVIGGSPGALIARRWFRHKTRKEPFSTRLLLIAVAQLGAIIGLAAFALLP